MDVVFAEGMSTRRERDRLVRGERRDDEEGCMCRGREGDEERGEMRRMYV